MSGQIKEQISPFLPDFPCSAEDVRFIGKPVDFDTNKVKQHLEVLSKIIENENVELIDSVMREFVTTYIRPEDANRKEKVNEVSACS